jgi:hypothetical protein
MVLQHTAQGILSPGHGCRPRTKRRGSLAGLVDRVPSQIGQNNNNLGAKQRDADRDTIIRYNVQQYLAQAAPGVKQDLILDNLDRVITEWYETGRIDQLIRIPMIPGFTATDDNVAAIGKYCAARSENIKIELLNFNPLARDKYERMYRNYPFEADQRMFTSDEMDYFRSLLQAQGVMAIK